MGTFETWIIQVKIYRLRFIKMHNKPLLFVFIPLSVLLLFGFGMVLQEGGKLGDFEYKDFEKPNYCGSCHNAFYQQWSQSMMAKAYVHHWDEIEYFKLAVPHSEKDPKMKEAQEGCNGCHAPLSYMAGDVPPPRPEEGSRANEAV